MEYEEYQLYKERKIVPTLLLFLSIIITPIIGWKMMEWFFFPELMKEGLDTTKINPIHDFLSLFSEVEWTFVFVYTILLLILFNTMDISSRCKK